MLSETKLFIPDVRGNKLFQGYENIETNPKAGLIFFIPGCGITVRANGRVRVVQKGEAGLVGVDAEVFEPDEEAKIIQALVMTIDEVYPHCPRALAFSRLWDVDTIRANGEIHSEGEWTRKWFGGDPEG